MKILTWNINGIRAAKVPLKNLLDSLDSDIICLQETKITRNMLDSLTAQVDDYNAYFSFSRRKSGYSGVVTYCKDTCIPFKAEEGLSNHFQHPGNESIGHYPNNTGLTTQELIDLDSEGRAVITQHSIKYDSGSSNLCIINVYCPRADPDREDRITYKHNFYRLLQARSENLINNGMHVVIVGDINATHKDIDHCNPAEQDCQRLGARLWMDQLLWKQGRDQSLAKHHNFADDESNINNISTDGLFIDAFRHIHPLRTDAYTNWTTLTGARLTNYGRRLDYILVDTKLEKLLQGSDILPAVEGSDHCPVFCDLNVLCMSSVKFPQLCAKFLPEVCGKQKKLSSYFSINRDDSVLKSTIREIVSENIKPVNAKINFDPSNVDTDIVDLKKRHVKAVKPVTNYTSEIASKRSTINDKSRNAKKAKLETKSKSGQMGLMSFLKSKVEQSTKSETIKLGGVVPTLELKNSDVVHDKKLPETKNFVTNQNTKAFKSDSQFLESRTNGKSDLMEQKLKSNPDSPNIQTNHVTNASAQWKSILKGLPPPPLCKGHSEPCVIRTVKKADSYNKGKQFYVCARPQGSLSNPDARCDYFQWFK